MNILVTGAKGFVGKNLISSLDNIQKGKDKRFFDIQIDNIYCYDVDSSKEDLDFYCKNADFIYNLVGINRSSNAEEFAFGNFGFISELLNLLEKYNNKAPIMVSSSIQASLVGRYAEGEYGKTKKAGEDLIFKYGEDLNVKTYVYRFPNLFGKWCKPNYNSVVATFCYNIANDLEIKINDRNTTLELLYIDDLIFNLILLLQEKVNRCDYDGINVIANEKGKYCFVDKTHKVALGEIADLLYLFNNQSKSLVMPEIPKDSFAKKLYSTFLSYLPKEKIKISLKMNEDNRGSFTEILKTQKSGQFSVNVSKPGITKGQHWHHTKWEFFIVVYGEALIEERKIGSDEILKFYVSGDKIEAVHMLPGYTHNIRNLSSDKELITLMWANENFEIDNPDTFYEEV